MEAELMRIAVEGRGGQGVLTLGKILGIALGEYYKYVTISPSYTAEMFGGPCYSYVVASNEAFHNPIPESVDMGISLDGAIGEILSKSLCEESEILIAKSSRTLLSILRKETLSSEALEILKDNRKSDFPINIYLFVVAARYLGIGTDVVVRSLYQSFPEGGAETYVKLMDALAVEA
ncbi:2-oxoacid:acceptor oxidoreductase family protein [Burkholderia cepacia]|uniref:2-oxoacid:acceptor oxidoreductase family protein n=1 Tax=Burkholderia cepacia TaxID=292 RepID=UPI001CF11713|nr:2-oxoacid:acceptor oxidoreductase family protein [Burkholderia cepacia]MCA8350740.1 2-oxoacid:acceptor oxidoreductase family protein [Burkholderia cepacia]